MRALKWIGATAVTLSRPALGWLLATTALAWLAACQPSAAWRPPARLAPAVSGVSAASTAPPLVEDFLAAYARGDEAAAERVASPLYAAEWARRGLTSAQRAALAPVRQARDRSGVWARFTYAGTIAGRAGFAHHLYAAWPAHLATGQHPQPSVWRVDTAPDGRVIWLELVWLCTDKTTRLVPVTGVAGTSEAGILPLPATLTATRAAVVLGVRAAVGQEGYYALRLPQAQQGAADVRFVGVDEQGAARPGAWTYGQRDTGPSEYGTPPRRFQETLAPEYEALQRAYLSALAI